MCFRDEVLVKALALVAALAVVAACAADESSTAADATVSTTTVAAMQLALVDGQVWLDLSDSPGAALDQGTLSIQAGTSMLFTVNACPRPAVRMINDVAEVGKVFEEDESGNSRSLPVYVPLDLPIGEYSIAAECFYSDDVGWSSPRRTVTVLPGQSDEGSTPAESQPSYFCIFDSEPPCRP